MKAYKYIKKEFVKGMVKAGQIRVGTIYEYRGNYENIEIGDANEGSITARNYVDDLKITDPNALPEYLKGAIGFDPSLKEVNVRIRNTQIFQVFNYPDAYIYCVTLKPSRKIMLDFGCDACVEISDIRAFSHLVAKKMLSKGLIMTEYLADPCIYVEPTVEGSAFEHTDDGQTLVRRDYYFLKRPNYSHQEEFRIGMFTNPPSYDRLTPQIIVSKPLAALCKEIVLWK